MRMKKTKARVLLLALVLLLTVSVGGTLAYLIDNGGTIQNLFNPSEVSCRVSESSSGGYTVQNTGNVDAYIRVAVVVNWVDDSGDIFYVANAPTPTITASGWTKHGDYYYFPKAVSPQIYIGDYITVASGTLDGYTAKVEIVAQAIQSVPTSVVTEAWGMSVNADGTLNVGG